MLWATEYLAEDFAELFRNRVRCANTKFEVSVPVGWWAFGKFHGRSREKEQPQILPLRVRMTAHGG
jgi:hypothetical protein